VRISAAEQTCRVSHISLWRDVHYTVSENVQRATLHKPVHLRKKGQDGALDDEYFVLGDNSANSEDGRLWPTHASAIDLISAENLSAPAGRVPGRFLIGKAFFVYWPAGYRPVSDVLPGLVPNFGEMRFIH
jgi:hypothetical protein